MCEIIKMEKIETSKITYKEVICIENLEKGLERTKKNVTPGIDGETKAEITKSRLQKLHEELNSQTYQPKPSKKVAIPKPDGGVRHLGIASQIDKVVQGAILTILEPILEKTFKKESFGFRPGIGCHNALKHIKYQWKAITWIINVDIKKCFDKINHELLLKKLENFCDQPLVELIRKLLKAGYVDINNLNDRAEYVEIGTPQGSLISPILCNLYLHELDEFVLETLVKEYNKGTNRPKIPEYSKRYTLNAVDKTLIETYPNLKKALMRAKHNEFVKSGRFSATDGQDPEYRRLHYVRYADDFILGFIGPKKEAEDIAKEIKAKLLDMKLEANEEKSKIYHSSENGIKYLGMYIRFFTHNKIVTRENETSDSDITRQINANKQQAVNTAHFRAPIDRMLKKLTDKGIAKAREDGSIRGTAYIKLSMLEDGKIVSRFSAIIRGILNYYSCINHRSDLWKVFAILRKSCALTLAHKHKMGSAARVYAKFGPNLRIKNTAGETIQVLEYPKSLKTKIDFKTRSGSIQYPAIMDIEIDKVEGSHKTNLKTSDKCEYEGCEETGNLESHHINPMSSISKRKDLTAFEKALLQRKRKVVMLCKKHHNLVHKKRILK